MNYSGELSVGIEGWTIDHWSLYSREGFGTFRVTTVSNTARQITIWGEEIE